MFLSDRDLRFAIETRQLLVDPTPQELDTTSIDLHLARIEQAGVGDAQAFAAQQAEGGNPPFLGVGRFDYKAFAGKFAVPVPPLPQSGPGAQVYRDGER